MESDRQNAPAPTRRDVVRLGAGLLAMPAALAAGQVMAQESRAATSESAPGGNGQPLKNPRDAYPKPPFPKQQQEWPGLASKMDPRPDHGEQSYRGSGKLVGRRALITGGDSGIGRAAAIAYAREGADVAINYLPAEEPDAREVVELIRAAGRKSAAIPGDIRDEEFCNRLVADAVAQLGGLDILVNNAARQVSQPSLEQITTQQFDETFKTNVYAMFWITKAALKHLPPGSAIINTASIVGYTPPPSLVDYSMTKSCMITFTKAMAKQLASRGIRVNAVAPGPFWTPLQPSGGQPPDALVNFGQGTALGRPGQPAELASTYVLLASADSTYITGEVFGNAGGSMPY